MDIHQQQQNPSPTDTTPLLQNSSSFSHPTSNRNLAKSLFIPLIAFISLLILIPLYLHVPSQNDNQDSLNGPINSRRIVGRAFRQLQPSFTKDQLCMVALGDWGRRGHFGQRLVASALASAAHVAKRARPIIVSTGDNFYHSGVASPEDSHFEESYEQVYSQAQLKHIPWYVVLGNHDHLGSINAQIDYTSKSSRWNMPHAYYEKRIHPKLHAFFLDTTPYVDGNYGRIAMNATHQRGEKLHDQTNWFKTQIAKVPDDIFILVVAHHNMYSMSTSDHLGTLPVRDEFEPIILKYHSRVLAYISGHEHSLMHMQPYGRFKQSQNVIDHFVSGAGSKLSPITEPRVDEREKMNSCCGILPVSSNHTAPRTVWGSSTHGFMVFQFDGDKFTAAAVDDYGNIIYNYEKDVPELTS